MKPLQVLVPDTSVLIDRERGSLLDATFRLPFEFAVPDLLYRRELQKRNGEELLKLGLSVQVLDGKGEPRPCLPATGARLVPSGLLCPYSRADPILDSAHRRHQPSLPRGNGSGRMSRRALASRSDAHHRNRDHPGGARRFEHHCCSSPLPPSSSGNSPPSDQLPQAPELVG